MASDSDRSDDLRKLAEQRNLLWWSGGFTYRLVDLACINTCAIGVQINVVIKRWIHSLTPSAPISSYWWLHHNIHWLVAELLLPHPPEMQRHYSSIGHMFLGLFFFFAKSIGTASIWLNKKNRAQTMGIRASISKLEPQCMIEYYCRHRRLSNIYILT